MENSKINPLWFSLGVDIKYPNGRSTVAYSDCQKCKGTGYIKTSEMSWERVKKNKRWISELTTVEKTIKCFECQLRYGSRSAILEKLNDVFNCASSLYFNGGAKHSRLTQEQFLNDERGNELNHEYLSLLRMWWNRESEPGYKIINTDELTEETVNLYHQISDMFSLDLPYGDYCYILLSNQKFYSIAGYKGTIIKRNNKSIDVKINEEIKRMKYEEFLSQPVFLYDQYNKTIQLYQSNKED